MPALATSVPPITAPSLQPAEVPTPLKRLRQADCYQQVGVKYPHRATFHSYTELLHAGLLEGDPAVTTYIPHPFRLRVAGGPYVPDCYVVNNGHRQVCELTAHGEFNDALRTALETFFAFHAMQFVVIANESILARETDALNWLHIVRTLSTATALQSDRDERAVWERVQTAGEVALGELLDPGNRLGAITREIALYRLLHRGVLRADWGHRQLGVDTVIRPCG